jgi:MoaA/NifB/PqqE/SkfB family radical SAM enzyme
MIINALLTRNCNLRCSYCNIIKDYPNKPFEYGKVTRFKTMPAEDWMNIFNKARDNFDPNVFILLYGGEPTLYQDFSKLVRMLHNDNFEFSVITNATKLSKEIINPLLQEGVLKGLTCSVDPFTLTSDISRQTKSEMGLQLLIDSKRKFPNLDAVAEVVIDKNNYMLLPETVRILSQNGIWASISMIETQVTPYYDFASPCDNLLITDDIAKKLLRQLDYFKRKGRLIHAPEAFRKTLYDFINNKEKRSFCDLSKMDALTIEPNGEVRMCLRVSGTNLVNAKENFTKEALLKSFEENKKYCQGCNWTCPFMVNVVH